MDFWSLDLGNYWICVNKNVNLNFIAEQIVKTSIAINLFKAIRHEEKVYGSAFAGVLVSTKICI